MRGILVIVAAVLRVAAWSISGQTAISGDWPSSGRDAGGTQYSPLTGITPDNVNASFDRSNAQTGARSLAGLHGSPGSTSLGFVEEDDGVVLAFLPNLVGAAYAAASEFGPWSVFAHLDLADYRRDASLNEDGFDADRRVVTVGIDRPL